MSTGAVAKAILATMDQMGASDLATIEVDVTVLAAKSSGARTTLVFVTYDSLSPVADLTGQYGFTTSSGEGGPSSGTQQTAVLLMARTPIAQTLTLTFTSAVAAPVNWRAVGVVFDGQPSEDVVPPVAPITGPYTLPDASVDPENEHAMYVSFFASARDVPAMSNPGPLKIESVTDNRSVSYTHYVMAYGWNQLAATAMGTGPWWYAQVSLGWLTAVSRPPPTDSDDYWAVPAPCDAADILLINNNLLAPTWDADVTEVFDQPDSLLLNFVEEDGTKWMLSDLDGWWTLPPPALPDLPRPGYLDGSFPVDGRYEPRVIVMRGTFWPGPNVSVSQPRLRLLRALDAVRGGALLVVKEPVWAKQSWVWLADQPKVDTKDSLGRTDFEVQLKAIDPIKYHSGLAGLRKHELPYAGALDGRDYTSDPVVGERFVVAPARRFTAGTTQTTTIGVINSGTANVSPRFFIYGPATNVGIINKTTNERMVFQGTIPEGKMLVVDCYWRVVVMTDASTSLLFYTQYGELDGENRRWMLRLSSPWIHLQPGENEMYYQGSNVSFPTDPAEPKDPATIPTDMTQCWITYRSGWVGS